MKRVIAAICVVAILGLIGIAAELAPPPRPKAVGVLKNIPGQKRPGQNNQNDNGQQNQNDNGQQNQNDDGQKNQKHNGQKNQRNNGQKQNVEK